MVTGLERRLQRLEQASGAYGGFNSFDGLVCIPWDLTPEQEHDTLLKQGVTGGMILIDAITGERNVFNV